MNFLLQASFLRVKLTHAYITLRFRGGVTVCACQRDEGSGRSSQAHNSIVCMCVCVKRANGLSSLGNAPVSSLTYGNRSLNAESHYQTNLHKDSFK